MANIRKISDEQVVAAYLLTRIKKYAYFDWANAKSFDYASNRGWKGNAKYIDHYYEAKVCPIDWKDCSISEYRIGNLYGVHRSALNRRIKKWSSDSVKGFLKNKWRRKKVARLVSGLFYSLRETGNGGSHESDRIKIDAIKDKAPIEFWIALSDLKSEGIHKDILPKAASKIGFEERLVKEIIDEFLSFDREEVWSNYDEQKVLEYKIDILNSCGAKLAAKLLKESLKP